MQAAFVIRFRSDSGDGERLRQDYGMPLFMLIIDLLAPMSTRRYRLRD